MEELNAQYIAGFVDGEGCVSVYAKSGSRGHGIQVQIVQNAHSQSRHLFDTMQRHFGGKIREQKLYSGNTKLCLDFHGDCAAEFLEKISPFLCLKKEQALISLAWQKSRPARTRNTLGRLVPISDDCYKNNCLVAKCLAYLKKHTWSEYCMSFEEEAQHLSNLEWWPFSSNR